MLLTSQALSSVLYAASRVPDLPELTTLHKMFMQKYGKVMQRRGGGQVLQQYWAAAAVAAAGHHRGQQWIQW
jgi:hypothetical protein